MSEVRIVVTRPAEGQDPDGPPNSVLMRATAVAYDLAKSPLDGARVLADDEIDADFGLFVEGVREDMDTLGYNLMMAHAKAIRARDSQLTDEDTRSEETLRDERAKLHMKLMMEFGDEPVELLGNMLAAFLAGTIESALDDPELPKMLEDWETQMKAAQDGAE